MVSSREPIQWPPHSLDLSPCDFYLRAYLDAEVFKQRPRTLEDFKTAAEEEIVQITTTTPDKFVRNFHERLNMCIAREGYYSEDIT